MKNLTKESFLAGAKFLHRGSDTIQYHYNNGIIYSVLYNMLKNELSYSSMYDVECVNDSRFIAIDYFCGVRAEYNIFFLDCLVVENEK